MASKPLGELNRAYWNANADDISKQQWVVDLSIQITEYIKSHIDWIGIAPASAPAPVTLLDYACGNGLASTALAPYVTTIRGIDVSDGMVEKYNEAARKQGLSEQQMHAVRGDLLVPEAEIPKALEKVDFYDFDIIVMSMALHHVEDPQLMTAKLVERLRDGGSLLIIDWAPSPKAPEVQGHGHEKDARDEGYQQDLQEAQQTMKRSGFDEEEMRKVFEDSGCSESEYVLHPDLSKLPSRFGGAKQLFFARGRK
ncbi:S-adenosyl-L-methionine-dependent methyltransferase [Bisporella sp. PMI_857]|nr:S-adenosyl-L-methionine-dependent methyltransferase [Bisporella sp. PMI_857]